MAGIGTCLRHMYILNDIDLVDFSLDFSLRWNIGNELLLRGLVGGGKGITGAHTKSVPEQESRETRGIEAAGRDTIWYPRG